MVHVDLYRKPLWYGQVNPKGLVPALVMNQQTYIESIDICKQLSENTDLLSKEELQVLDACEEFIHQGLLLVAGKTARRLWEIGEGIEGAAIHSFKQSCSPILSLLQRNKKGDFLLGKNFSILEAAYVPFMWRFQLVLNEIHQLHSLNFMEVELLNWMDSVMQRKSMQTTCQYNARLLEAYQQYMCMDFFDFITFQPNDLKLKISQSVQRN
eukprot:TRINITY_DN21929_c0_g1_i4.p3 TRINITY_DN21929_c0_g1~~TRINITY_DN21929_c0_g1_i4.p3  ORF type:complete len:211 (-),score=19.48 TRINITY_DN21929_c0_g1_i4:605-1237(-)